MEDHARHENEYHDHQEHEHPHPFKSDPNHDHNPEHSDDSVVHWLEKIDD